MFKKLISTICASTILFSCAEFSVKADDSNTVKRVYRTSVTDITNKEESTNYQIQYTATLEAYSNGKIHIEVNTIKLSTTSHERIVGSYSFNDKYIKPYNELTNTEKSQETYLGNCFTTYSYGDEDIIYTLSTYYERSFTYKADLYVREQYLASTIEFTFFGDAIKIPFGDATISTDYMDLQNTVVELKNENERLAKNNTELNVRISDLESDNTKLLEENKAYEGDCNNLKIENHALSSSIVKYEEENIRLKSELESFKKMDFDGNGLLTNADAQMILVYYTDSLVGKTTGKVEDYSEYVKQISG